MSPAAKSLDEIAAEITSLREEIEKLTIPTLMLAPVTAADPDTGTVTIAGVEGVEVPSTYVPEDGHLTPVLLNGLSPIVFAPAGPPTSAPPATLGVPTAVGTVAGLLVEWDAAPDANVRWNKGYYQLEWDDDPGFGSSTTLDTAATAAVLQDLTPGVDIYVRVRAVNYAGTPGGWSGPGVGTPIEVTTELIAPDSITETEIADDSISTPKLQALSVTANEIATGTITTTQLAAFTIVAGNIAAGTITATQIAAGTITATEIATLSLSVGKDIKSSNYVAGTTGWIIKGDGTVEIASAKIRGSVAAVDGVSFLGNGGFESNHVNLVGTVAVTNFDAGTTTGWSTSNCAIASTASQGKGLSGSGANALGMTASSAADMSVSTPTGTGGFVVTAGTVYHFAVWSKAAVSARTVGIYVTWYNAAGTVISGPTLVTGSATADATSYRLKSGRATAPALAAFARMGINVSGPANGEVHYLDWTIVEAAATDWVDDSGNANNAVSFAAPSEMSPSSVIAGSRSMVQVGQTSKITSALVQIPQWDGTSADVTIPLRGVAYGQRDIDASAGAFGTGFRVNILWYNSSSSLVQTDNGYTFPPTLGGQTPSYADVVAFPPSTAKYAALQIELQGSGANDVYYHDGASLATSSQITGAVFTTSSSSTVIPGASTTIKDRRILIGSGESIETAKAYVQLIVQGDPGSSRVSQLALRTADYGHGYTEITMDSPSENNSIRGSISLFPDYGGEGVVNIGGKISTDGGSTYATDMTAFTPTLTASTTNPVLGTGGSAAGGFVLLGHMVTGTINIHYGSGGGFTNGSGTYLVGLPPSYNADGTWYGSRHAIGTWTIRDGTTGTVYSGQLRLLSGTASSAILNISTGGSVTSAALGGMPSGTDIEISFSYFTP